MTGDLFQGGLLEAPLYPLKPDVSSGPLGLSGGPGPLRPPVIRPLDSRPMENRILKHRSCKQPEDVGAQFGASGTTSGSSGSKLTLTK